MHRSLFYGLGSDGTVGANHNSIRIIADKTDYNTQGYFVYDSKKAGAVTVSHLRFGKNPIRKPYLSLRPISSHAIIFRFLKNTTCSGTLKKAETFLLTSEFDKERDLEQAAGLRAAADHRQENQVLHNRRDENSADLGLGSRINVIMQTAFFQISKVIDSKHGHRGDQRRDAKIIRQKRRRNRRDEYRGHRSGA